MISVIVCTYNRAPILERFLQRIALLPANPPWELVVVDNNSADQTRNVVEQFKSRIAVPVTYIFEQRQGVSYAKNAALTRTSAEIVAFTDDDCIVGPDWIATIAEQFSSNPDTGILGGWIEAGPGMDPNLTTRREKEPAEVRSLADIERYLAGANMIFARSMINDVGLFDTCLGPGRPTQAGEDTDYIYRALRNGHRVHYSPDVRVQHLHNRTEPASIQAHRLCYIVGRGALYAKFLTTFDIENIRVTYWELCSLFRRRAADSSSHPPISRVDIAACLTRGAMQWLFCTAQSRLGSFGKTS